MKRKLPVESESHLRLNMELSASSVSVVTLLLSAFVHITPHRSERSVPRIVPSKLQLFEYSPLTVNCEGFFQHTARWRVVRSFKGHTVPCNRSVTFGPCYIHMVYPGESAEYWCESEDRQRRSQRVQITITVGGVVLESPVRPVMVGDTVTLRCITKENASTEFSFYKDGVEIKSSSDEEMTIHNISESDQGRYKCSQGKQFSGENLLQVKAVLLQSPDRPVMEGTNVTLVCSDKMAALNHTTVFYKDGVDVGDSSSGRLTLTVSKSDEGVYKCSSSEGRESEEQWLSVTTVGGVVLESPVHPVMVGDRVTLRCIKKKNRNVSTKFSFYKNGARIISSSDGEMTIDDISESDVGKYKCSTSNAEFSEEILLQVKERSIPVDRDNVSLIIISLLIGLVGLMIILLIIILKKVNETAVYQVTTNKDDEKTERSSFSRRDRGSASDSDTQQEIYNNVINSGKPKEQH